jgi:hypothetical protein
MEYLDELVFIGYGTQIITEADARAELTGN